MRRRQQKSADVFFSRQKCVNLQSQHNDMELAGKSIVFQTLGCKLNFAESSAIGKMLLAAGCRRAQAGEPADICIVNT